VLVFDDSMVARKQMCKTSENDMSLETTTTRNSKEAIDLLKGCADNKYPQLDRLAMVFSNIEMPEMDSYTVMTEVRAEEWLKNL
jgi:two-component system chemotaxis response regulator CheV